jgi:integrase
MARRKTYQKPEPKVENGLWKIRYREPVEQPEGTIRREQRTKCLGSVLEVTLSEARKERDRFLQRINDVAVGVEHGRKTMAMLVARWTAAVRPTFKFSTQTSYDWALKRILPAFGNSVLSTIGRAEVQTFLTIAGKTLSPESVRDLRRCLRGLFSVAQDWGWTTAEGNPAAGRIRLPERIAKRPKVVLWPEQFWALARNLKQPYRAIVILAVLGGLRRGELAALKWNDNLEPGKVVVDEACYWGKADKRHNLNSWRVSSPKTVKSQREVAIGAIAQQAIHEWRDARWPSTGKPMARFAGPDDYMFAIRTNTPIDLHTAVERHLKAAATAAKVPGVSWHDLRHTYTTWGRLAGMRPEIMRDQLGHSSVLMTLDVYSHANQPRELAGEVAMIEQYAMASSKVM